MQAHRNDGDRHSQQAHDNDDDKSHNQQAHNDDMSHNQQTHDDDEKSHNQQAHDDDDKSHNQQAHDDDDEKSHIQQAQYNNDDSHNQQAHNDDDISRTDQQLHDDDDDISHNQQTHDDADDSHNQQAHDDDSHSQQAHNDDSCPGQKCCKENNDNPTHVCSDDYANDSGQMINFVHVDSVCQLTSDQTDTHQDDSQFYDICVPFDDVWSQLDLATDIVLQESDSSTSESDVEIEDTMVKYIIDAIDPASGGDRDRQGFGAENDSSQGKVSAFDILCDTDQNRGLDAFTNPRLDLSRNQETIQKRENSSDRETEDEKDRSKADQDNETEEDTAGNHVSDDKTKTGIRTVPSRTDQETRDGEEEASGPSSKDNAATESAIALMGTILAESVQAEEAVAGASTLPDNDDGDSPADVTHDATADEDQQLEDVEDDERLESVLELLRAGMLDLPLDWEDEPDLSRLLAAHHESFMGECQICLIQARVARRPCHCQMAVCKPCLTAYLCTQVSQGIVRIQCPGSDCSRLLNDYVITNNIPVDMKRKFHKFLVDASNDPTLKTCPRCSAETKVEKKELRKKTAIKKGLAVTCGTCALHWCFTCHTPWHEGVSCKEHRRVDVEFTAWAKQQDGDQFKAQANARKCPTCKVYIQRAAGCHHMTCSRCSTDFCYDCGQLFYLSRTEHRVFSTMAFRYLLGSHTSRLSLLGCPKAFLPESHVRRRIIRGSLFGCKLVVGVCALPVVVALGVGVGVFALPVVGTIKAARHIKQCTKTQ